jgi:hypothetical protein
MATRAVSANRLIDIDGSSRRSLQDDACEPKDTGEWLELHGPREEETLMVAVILSLL